MNNQDKQQYRHIRRVLLWVLVLNWAVASAKVFYGILSGCVSMAADGFHSFSDGTSNIIGLIGINIAYQPKDKEHPYGHRKYETFFSLGIAALLFIICFNLLKAGVQRLYHPVTPQVDLKSFLMMVITMGINLGVMNYEYKKGKTLGSDILISDSMHTRSDILTSFSVIIALVVIKLGLPLIDPIVTLIISLFIAHTGYKIVKKSSAILCDTAPIVDVNKIRNIVLSIKGVHSCHKIRTRGRPDDIHLDLHVQVKPDMHIDNAHKISYTIEEAIKKDIPQVTDVIVHMEPK